MLDEHLQKEQKEQQNTLINLNQDPILINQIDLIFSLLNTLYKKKVSLIFTNIYICSGVWYRRVNIEMVV